MSSQGSLFDSPSATSSPESGSGAMPCDSPAGQTTANVGLEAAPALPLAQRAKGKGLQTLVTSGRNGFGSSASAALQSSLESRLLPRLDTAGSTLFVEIWKRKATPLRRRYWEHTARARPTSGKGCTSLDSGQMTVNSGQLASTPTPTLHDAERGGQAKRAMAEDRHGSNLQDFALLAAVPTPQTHDDRLRGNTEADCHYYPHDLSNAAVLSAVPSPCTPTGGRSMSTEAMDATGHTLDGRKHTASLEHAGKFASVATPRSEDSESTGAHRGKPDTLHSQTMLASVSTPRVSDDNMSRMGLDAAMREMERPNAGSSLALDAFLCSVTSPSARDWKDTSGMSESGVDPDGSTRSRLDQLPRQAQLADSGQTATGGTAGTASSGQLDPAYSRWLMGLPAAWCDCAVTAMASLQKQRKSSSKRTSK
jgi:hypothetical protein